MMPMRANIVGPPDVATRINASIAACHSGVVCSAFASFVIPAGILQRDELVTARQRDRFVEATFPATISHGGGDRGPGREGGAIMKKKSQKKSRRFRTSCSTSRARSTRHACMIASSDGMRGEPGEAIETLAQSLVLILRDLQDKREFLCGLAVEVKGGA
jgi:hypothetical protein